MSVSATVNRPVAEAWQWYAVEHVRNHPRWDPEMELEQLTDGPLGVGSRIHRRNRHFEKPVDGEMVVVEWGPEQAMGVEIHDANLEAVGRVVFEELGPALTRLTIEADFPGMDASAADRIRPRMERTARNISQLIESDPRKATSKASGSSI